MKKIKRLSEDVIIQIAAGEVIERPSNIVKELVENSLDAGAENITVLIEKNGAKRIEVIDDGCGMSEEDVQEAPKIHATSKIQSSDDLYSINSFGFRGEALASIAAMSTVTIRSRLSEDIKGHELVIENGKVLNMKPVGMPKGTHIIVEDLYKNVPARKKTLDEQTGENKLITQVVMKYALIYPEVRFLLKNDKKIVIDEQKKTSMKDRINLYFKKNISDLVPFSHNSDGLTVRGFLGKPSVDHVSKDRQLLFINRRPVKSSILSKHIKETYGKAISARKYPIFILDIRVPAKDTDVNVHPKKEKVKMRSEKDLIEELMKTLHETLHQPVHEYSDEDVFVKDAGMDSYLVDSLRKSKSQWDLKKAKSEEAGFFQYKKLYLVFVMDDGIAIIDQHAAHERILYEELKQQLQETIHEKDIVKLKKPLLIEVAADEIDAFQENTENLHNLGFTLEEFGDGTFKVSSIPKLLKDRDIEKTIRELTNSVDAVDDVSDKTITYMACRGAVKAGDTLSKDEGFRLLEKLFTCEEPLTCPHGRPTFIEYSKSTLDKMFKRV